MNKELHVYRKKVPFYVHRGYAGFGVNTPNEVQVILRTNEYDTTVDGVLVGQSRVEDMFQFPGVLYFGVNRITGSLGTHPADRRGAGLCTFSVTWLCEYHIQLQVFYVDVHMLKMIYHPLYGMNNYVLIWGDWPPCDPLRGSHDIQSPHIWGDWLSCDRLRGSHDGQSPHIRKHLCPILWLL